MRKIKFRGKRTDTGQWVYGYYVFQRARGGIHGQQMTADDLDRHLTEPMLIRLGSVALDGDGRQEG